jgi:hypothetical protein
LNLKKRTEFKKVQFGTKTQLQKRQLSSLKPFNFAHHLTFSKLKFFFLVFTVLRRQFPAPKFQGQPSVIEN